MTKLDLKLIKYNPYIMRTRRYKRRPRKTRKRRGGNPAEYDLYYPKNALLARA